MPAGWLPNAVDDPVQLKNIDNFPCLPVVFPEVETDGKCQYQKKRTNDDGCHLITTLSESQQPHGNCENQ